MVNNHTKMSPLSISLRVILRLFLGVWGVTVVFPLIWLIFSSFKNNQEFYRSPWELPGVFRIENYVNAWITANISRYFVNSLIMVVGTLIIFLLIVSTTSYILAKYRFPGVKILKSFYFLAMMLPAALQLVPLYFQMASLHLTDNLFVLMVIYAVQSLPVSVFLLTGFIENINESFIEAAVVDGAGEWYVFSRVVIPFVKPILFFLCLGNIMGTWNEFIMALTFIRTEALYTIPIGLSYLANTMQYRTDFGALFASLVISIIPVLILYGIFQKQILEGTESGDGLKG